MMYTWKRKQTGAVVTIRSWPRKTNCMVMPASQCCSKHRPQCWSNNHPEYPHHTRCSLNLKTAMYQFFTLFIVPNLDKSSTTRCESQAFLCHLDNTLLWKSKEIPGLGRLINIWTFCHVHVELVRNKSDTLFSLRIEQNFFTSVWYAYRRYSSPLSFNQKSCLVFSFDYFTDHWEGVLVFFVQPSFYSMPSYTPCTLQNKTHICFYHSYFRLGIS